ncbi:MAG: GNAT family N-acetyltransferase [Alphaproteobacteria bacterium]|nr:GNAT family N-acetyltransferase [Alphaproteobacteria bacterium]MBU0859362.1 GNAT family N-acetyltransferase [Alphaproteobacteria bacterium]
MTSDKKHILIPVPMPVVTPRLTIRAPQEGDGMAVHAAKVESMDDLRPWMPWARESGTVDDNEIVAREAAAKFILREDLMLFAFENSTGDFVAGTGLHRMNWDGGDFEIGYWVRTSAQGKGYATEITNALTRYAFGALNAARVHITHAAGNERSAAVIRKLGFVEDGVLRKRAFMPDNTHKDLHVYSRLDTDGLPELDVRWRTT